MKILKPLMCILLLLMIQTTSHAKNKARTTKPQPDACSTFSNTLTFILLQNSKDVQAKKLFAKVPDTGVVSISPTNKLPGTQYERFTRSAQGKWMYRAVIAEVKKDSSDRLDSIAMAWQTKLLPCINSTNLWQKSNMEFKASSENRKYFLDYENAADKNKKFWITKSCVGDKCELVLMAG